MLMQEFKGPVPGSIQALWEQKSAQDKLALTAQALQKISNMAQENWQTYFDNVMGRDMPYSVFQGVVSGYKDAQSRIALQQQQNAQAQQQKKQQKKKQQLKKGTATQRKQKKQQQQKQLQQIQKQITQSLEKGQVDQKNADLKKNAQQLQKIMQQTIKLVKDKGWKKSAISNIRVNAHRDYVQQQTKTTNREDSIAVLAKMTQQNRQKILAQAGRRALKAQDTFIRDALNTDTVPAQILRDNLTDQQYNDLVKKQNAMAQSLFSTYASGSGLNQASIKKFDDQFERQTGESMDAEGYRPAKTLAQSRMAELASSSSAVRNLVTRIIQQLTKTIPYVNSPKQMARKLQGILLQIPSQQRAPLKRLVGTLIHQYNSDQVRPVQFDPILSKMAALISPKKNKYLLDMIFDTKVRNQALFDSKQRQYIAQQQAAGLADIDRILKSGAYDNYSLRPNITVNGQLRGNLSAFTNWAATQAKKTQQSVNKLQALKNRHSSINDPASQYYTGVNGIDPDRATWDVRAKRWVGPAVDAVQKTFKSTVVNINKKNIRNQLLLANTLDAQQVLASVPPIIGDLVRDNENLSLSGFGPIKPGGVNLYAGRWLDKVTGRMRVLPTATKQFVNPISAQQNIGYHEARQLNHWNNILNQQEYIRQIKKDPKQWQLKQKAKLIDQLKYGQQLGATLHKMGSKIEGYFQRLLIQGSKKSYFDILCTYADQTALKKALRRANNAPMLKVGSTPEIAAQNQIINKQNTKILMQLQVIMDDGYAKSKIALQSLPDSQFPRIKKDKLQASLQVALTNFLTLRATSLGHALKQITKAAMIPDTQNLGQLITASQKYKQQQQQIGKWAANPTNIQNIGSVIARAQSSLKLADGYKSSLRTNLDQFLNKLQIKKIDGPRVKTGKRSAVQQFYEAMPRKLINSSE